MQRAWGLGRPLKNRGGSEPLLQSPHRGQVRDTDTAASPASQLQRWSHTLTHTHTRPSPLPSNPGSRKNQEPTPSAHEPRGERCGPPPPAWQSEVGFQEPPPRGGGPQVLTGVRKAEAPWTPGETLPAWFLCGGPGPPGGPDSQWLVTVQTLQGHGGEHTESGREELGLQPALSLSSRARGRLPVPDRLSHSPRDAVPDDSHLENARATHA